MDKFSSSQLGYFLKFDLWLEAIKLLDFQIGQMENNKHYNTLSMFYYKETAHFAPSIKTEEYFQEKVASNLFYGLQHEFGFYDYVIPKGFFGLRNQKLLTYPMRVLYYSICLYLLKLSQEFLQGYVKKNNHLKCYYGGDLKFDQDTLSVNHKNTYYQFYYKEFRNQVRDNVENSSENKLVIKIDIQNYFDNISIKILLENLDRFVKPSFKELMNFDTSTKEQIRFYFNYLSKNKQGIPQADNDISSSVLSHLYFTFIDLCIESEIRRNVNSIKDYKIVRFVDDAFIFIDFNEDIDDYKRQCIAELITSEISDILHHKAGLRLNTKTRLYWLNDSNQKETLLKDLKKISPNYYFKDTDSRLTPQNKVDDIFAELNKIKKSSIGTLLGDDGSLQDEILKEVYDTPVNKLLDKKENKARIEEIFTDFNFDLVKVRPREIIIIISKNPKSMEEFSKFLHAKEKASTRDLYLIIKFLCQTNFADIELFKKLETGNEFEKIFKVYHKMEKDCDLTGYYNLSANSIKSISKDPHIVEQIRLRVFNEKIESYSVALNHLLNEIHAIALLRDQQNKKTNEYEADDAVNYLIYKGVPHEICIDIRNLFDRRNRNTVSHPGSEQRTTWGVTKEEYFKYLEAVGKCLEIIL
jgi:AbiA family abortive infection protein